MSIAISNMSFSFDGELPLFSEVSFKVGSGEHWAILGENGPVNQPYLR